MIADFECSYSAKVILAGEHTVLRGGSAVAIPYEPFKLKLSYYKIHQAFRVEPSQGAHQTMQLLKLAFEELGVPLELFPKQGRLVFENQIPMGSGLGSSAAFCVSLITFVSYLAGITISEQKRIHSARILENRFHGQSSGLDISVITLQKPILFKMNQDPVILDSPFLPSLKLIDTGIRASTKKCVEQVNDWRTSHSEKALEIDGWMGESVQLAKEALLCSDKDLQEEFLKKSMKLSHLVYETWGLIPELIQKHIHSLDFEAIRLTGSGNGGFLVCLK